MQISSIKNLSKTPFGIAPTKKGLIEMDKLCAEGEKLLCGENSTSTTFDIPQYSMYSNEDSDTGIGKFASEESLYCIKTMKPYIGFDSEKIYPIGRFTSNGYAQLKFFCPYERGSFTIGEDNIEWNLLTKEEYGNILEKKDIKEFVEQNKNTRTRKEDINYENELGLDENYPIYKLLKKSYANFQDLPSLHPLKREFQSIKKNP